MQGAILKGGSNMKCEYCRFAPSPDTEEYIDECPYWEKYGTVWKDGKYGCTLSYRRLQKNEDDYSEYLGDMGTDMGLESMLEEKDIREETVIEACKAMIGMDKKKPYIRNGEKYFTPIKNAHKGNENWILIMADLNLAEKVIKDGQEEYVLTSDGIRWLSRMTGVKISVSVKTRIKEKAKESQEEGKV